MRSTERWDTDVSCEAFKLRPVIVKTKGFLALFRQFLQIQKGCAPLKTVGRHAHGDRLSSAIVVPNYLLSEIL